MKLRLLGLVAPVLLLACGEEPPPQVPTAPPPVVTPPPPPPPPPAPKTLDRLSRTDFNRVAPELALPIFWTSDDNGNKTLDPNELAIYWGLERGAKLADYVAADGTFTPKLLAAYEAMVRQSEAPPSSPRNAAVRKELAQGRTTLVASDFSKATPEEKKFVAAILKAAEKIEVLYAKQEGTLDLMAKLPPNDPASKTLFFRNQEPKCKAPATEADPNCGALLPEDMPKTKISGLYPAKLLADDPKFCEGLGKSKDKTLADPFTTVVADEKGELKSRPYHETWKADVAAIAADIKEASAALGGTEPALRAYLDAAAKAFLDDDWWPADEAWANMDTKSSKFYLRIGPDEVYHEPCSTKALFHVSFALVNQGAAKWQAKLDPLKTEMENAIAKLAGPPYTARKVSFKIPDFIDVVLNAGDSRPPSGATIGQSLPNFGPVANQGRGRTVAMTNFYSDPDSVAAAKGQADSLFCKDTMTKWTDDPEALLMSTVLHEAAHNLGPAHQYKANGKIDREAFGGPLASTLEELKAQTAALYYTDWLVGKKQLDKEAADKTFVRDVFWAFGHVSRGMYEDNHHPKNYSQLAAIQVGWLMKNGAMSWKADATAANEKDKGCFEVDLPKVPAAVTSLMKEVAQIKGKGDKARAEVLIKEWVDVTGDRKKVHEVITERMTRAPKQTFVYSVKLD
ncbi:MAG: hypothetical protein KIT84_12580 [Labilithrix sp.]|nr:hypothetical protein [Labilithrix sp.]MCW5811850.1 hypothetical protein [Labilithrix sp.]